MSWYWHEVRGNVLAIIPCAFVAWLWLRSKHAGLKEAHRALSVSHAQTHAKLLELIDAMDTDTDGGLGPKVEEVRASLDPKVKGGTSGKLEEIHSSFKSIRALYR